MRIERLILKNFRGIRDMDLEFHPKLTVLAGVNGSGKSSILDAIAGLLARCLRKINKKVGRDLEFVATDCTYGCRNRAECLMNIQASGISPAFALGACLDPALTILGWVQAGSRLNESEFIAYVMEQAQPNAPPKRMLALRGEVPVTSEWQPHLPIFLLFATDRAIQPASERGILEDSEESRSFEEKYPMASAYTDALGSRKRFDWLIRWFKDREEIEIRGLRDISANMLHKLRLEGQSPEGIDPQLEAVRSAIEKFTGLKSPRFLGDPLRLVASKGDAVLPITSFSEGEKGLFAMIGDLARRLAIANPTLKRPLEGEGVVMIDEIELHLHPSWQRTVVQRLAETFPNIQFIITTHSPQVLGEIRSENIVLLKEGPNGIRHHPFSQEVHGMTSSHVLEAVMETSERNPGVANKMREAFAAIERNDLAKAKAILSSLLAEAKDIPELERIGMRIRRKEAIGK